MEFHAVQLKFLSAWFNIGDFLWKVKTSWFSITAKKKRWINLVDSEKPKILIIEYKGITIIKFYFIWIFFYRSSNQKRPDVYSNCKQEFPTKTEKQK